MIAAARSPIVLVLVLLALSCSSRQNNTKPPSDAPPSGQVSASVRCLRDPSVSYAVYLPSGYTHEKKFPVMLAFDPHANGKLPVEKYKDLAEKYGYILIGSNDSKNGLNQTETGGIVFALFEEITEQYSCDTSRIYTLGFSGGGRVAGLVGLFRGGVAGVISCGAGLPGTNQQARFRPDFLGIAGLGDFNMFELLSLDGQLGNAGFHHALILYDGIHSWPPAPVMEEAFTWSDFSAMKNSRAMKNDRQIGDYIKKKDSLLEELAKKGQILKEYDVLNNEIKFLSGLVPIDPYKNRLAALESDPVLQRDLDKRKTEMEKELKLQETYTENMFVKNIGWWRKEITNYELRITNSKKPEDTLAARRMLSYLSLLGYMTSSRALAMNDTASVTYALQVYAWADPDNSEVWYLSAILAMKENNMPKALGSLEKAVSKGFNEKARMQKQPEFQPLLTNEAFSGLLQKIK